jgi:hypothetical protein
LRFDGIFFAWRLVDDPQMVWWGCRVVIQVMRLLPSWWKVLVKLGTVYKSFVFMYHHRITTAC